MADWHLPKTTAGDAARLHHQGRLERSRQGPIGHEDGALTADKLDGKDIAYLVSKNSYKDFEIRAEFWTDEEANSGIFLRCDQSDKIDSRSATRCAPLKRRRFLVGASPTRQPLQPEAPEQSWRRRNG